MDEEEDQQLPLSESLSSMMPSSLSPSGTSANANPPPSLPPPQHQGQQLQQQPQPMENMIIDPPSTRVKRFVFRSRRRQSFSFPSSSNPPNLGGVFGGVVAGPSTSGSNNNGNNGNSSEEFDTIEVIVPEKIQASYGLYVWPAAGVLAWYLFENRQYLPGKRILELGAGTALPGVVAALCGAQVTLSDSAKLTHCLDQCRRTAEVNGVGDKVKVIGLTWGLFLNTLTKLKGEVDLLLGSDCFYDPSVFEDLISTVAYILEHNPKAKFLATYQERSADWSIQHLLTKWSLKCKHVPLNELANSNQIDLLALMQDHTIHLLEITLKGDNSQEVHSDEDVF